MYYYAAACIILMQQIDAARNRNQIDRVFGRLTGIVIKCRKNSRLKQIC